MFNIMDSQFNKVFVFINCELGDQENKSNAEETKLSNV